MLVKRANSCVISVATAMCHVVSEIAFQLSVNRGRFQVQRYIRKSVVVKLADLSLLEQLLGLTEICSMKNPFVEQNHA